MSNDLTVKSLRLAHRITRIKCRLGFHAWEAFTDNVRGGDGRRISLGWWVCKHCCESQLKLILPNGQKPL